MDRSINNYINNYKKCKKQNRNSDILTKLKEIYEQNKFGNNGTEYQAIDYKTAEIAGLTQDTADKINRLYHVSTQSDYESFKNQLYEDKNRIIDKILKTYQDKMDQYKKEQQKQYEHLVNDYQFKYTADNEESDESYGGYEEDLEQKKQEYITKMNDLIDQLNDAFMQKDFKLFSQLRKEMIELDIQYDNFPGVTFLNSKVNKANSHLLSIQLEDKNNTQQHMDDMDNSSCEIISIEAKDQSNYSKTVSEYELSILEDKETTEVKQNNATDDVQKQYESLTEYEIEDASEHTQQFHNNISNSMSLSEHSSEIIADQLPEDQTPRWDR